MFESEHKLRHLPFFEEVAGHAENDPAWHRATAGLVVLRLVDTWLEEAPFAPVSDFGVRSVRASIDAMADGTPIKSLLYRVVDALQEQKPDIHVVVTPLMAYAQALEYDAKWFLAADVYKSVLAHLHPVADADASVAAHLRLGQCCRNLNHLDDASAAFASAFEVATAAGDIVGVLRARIGDARVTTLRGNLPGAERILDEIIGQSASAELQDVRSRALHDRSNVATLRGDYELAVRLGYEALEQSQSPSERDRILGDIAGAFYYLGVFSAARDAYMILSATAQEQYTRWTATINLMELARTDGSEMLFELYRRQLLGNDLPPYVAVAYHMQTGLGYRAFGNMPAARDHLQRAVVLASEHRLNQSLFEAEQALEQLETPAPPRRGSSDVSLDTREVARAIHEKRLAEVSG